ncbi:type IV pilin [Candidatus Magnetobacterium bavaricum]|uniref:Type IV pilin n=1 Tax=Candidatus Magnetobacterium bavaricum TaxID=29290 RepID=A0A0F3H315_9BACT|nr:type IV pilin [Candidatus Magnetobacterium bavaricum]
MDEVLSDFINHHTNKGNKSPYTGLPLFVATHTTQGEIVLTPVDSRYVSITAYAHDIASPIFSHVVTSR